MSSTTDRASQVETAHVLFLDMVGYSDLHDARYSMEEQARLVAELREVVRNAPEFRRAEAGGELIRLPTRDGMALVFFRDPVAPVHCAIQITPAVRSHQ